MEGEAEFISALAMSAPEAHSCLHLGFTFFTAWPQRVKFVRCALFSQSSLNRLSSRAAQFEEGERDVPGLSVVWLVSSVSPRLFSIITGA